MQIVYKGLRHALKGHQRIAQGNALGERGDEVRPERAKALENIRYGFMLLPFQGAFAAVNLPRALTASSSSSLGIAGASSALLSLLRRLPWAMRLLGLQPAP